MSDDRIIVSPDELPAIKAIQSIVRTLEAYSELLNQAQR